MCEAEQVICPGPVDPSGCIMPDFCAPIMPGCPPQKFLRNLGCPPQEPVDCGAEMMLCVGAMDPMNCKMPDFCVPAKGNFLKATNMINSRPQY